jgi:hypothetical protein
MNSNMVRVIAKRESLPVKIEQNVCLPARRRGRVC